MIESLGQHLRSVFAWFRNSEGENSTEIHDRYFRAGLFWFWICVGIFLAFDSYNSFGSGLGALFFGIYFSIYVVWRLGKKFWTGKLQLRDFAVVVYATLVFVVADVGSDAFKRKHEANFAPLFSGLEQYRNTIGRYPDELDDLVPKYVTSIPECPIISEIYSPESSYRWNATSYGITCTVGGFIFPFYGMYVSEKATWVYNDDAVVY